MSGAIPTLPGWIPDPTTGGTVYWDGRQFTGYRRPPRRKFAATAHHRASGLIWSASAALLLMTGVVALWTPEFSWWAADDPPEGSLAELARVFEDPDTAFSREAFATLAIYVVLALVCASLALYRLRGRGPTTKAVNQRLAADHRARVRIHQQAMFSTGGAVDKPAGRKFRTALEWAALNLTHVGRAHKAFERGDGRFEVNLRVDRSGYRTTVEQIEERGWIFVGERWNKKRKTPTPNPDGTHTVRSTQTASFYFVRDPSADE